MPEKNYYYWDIFIMDGGEILNSSAEAMNIRGRSFMFILFYFILIFH